MSVNAGIISKLLSTVFAAVLLWLCGICINVTADDVPPLTIPADSLFDITMTSEDWQQLSDTVEKNPAQVDPDEAELLLNEQLRKNIELFEQRSFIECVCSLTIPELRNDVDNKEEDDNGDATLGETVMREMQDNDLPSQIADNHFSILYLKAIDPEKVPRSFQNRLVSIAKARNALPPYLARLLAHCTTEESKDVLVRLTKTKEESFDTVKAAEVALAQRGIEKYERRLVRRFKNTVKKLSHESEEVSNSQERKFYKRSLNPMLRLRTAETLFALAEALSAAETGWPAFRNMSLYNRPVVSIPNVIISILNDCQFLPYFQSNEDFTEWWRENRKNVKEKLDEHKGKWIYKFPRGRLINEIHAIPSCLFMYRHRKDPLEPEDWKQLSQKIVRHPTQLHCSKADKLIRSQLRQNTNLFELDTFIRFISRATIAELRHRRAEMGRSSFLNYMKAIAPEKFSKSFQQDFLQIIRKKPRRISFLGHCTTQKSKDFLLETLEEHNDGTAVSWAAKIALAQRDVGSYESRIIHNFKEEITEIRNNPSKGYTCGKNAGELRGSVYATTELHTPNSILAVGDALATLASIDLPMISRKKARLSARWLLIKSFKDTLENVLPNALPENMLNIRQYRQGYERWPQEWKKKRANIKEKLEKLGNDLIYMIPRNTYINIYASNENLEIELK